MIKQSCLPNPTIVRVYTMKRTTLVLDEKLVQAGLKSTGLKTPRALVEYALKELVGRETQLGLLKLKGRIHWTGNLNTMRKLRTQSATSLRCRPHPSTGT